MKQTNSSNSLSVGFRLSGENQAALVARAEKAGLSVHECARNLVIAGLAEKAQSEGEEIARLRADLALVLEAALIAGQILSPTDAKALIHDKLRLL